MRKIFTMIVLICAFFTVHALAAEQVVTVKPDSVTVLKTKTGENYVRILVTEKKEASGISFASSVTYNAYRDLVPAAAKLQPGKDATLVVEKREYQGRTYYTILGIKQQMASK